MRDDQHWTYKCPKCHSYMVDTEHTYGFDMTICTCIDCQHQGEFWEFIDDEQDMLEE